MLTLSFNFPAGRYHATPWDRHVNEGAVAWPPEPWRILRSLIATWHHKAKHAGKHDENTLKALIESLARDPPEYHLPPAIHSHTRHYMPQFAAGDTKLVFDAFTAVKRDDPLTVVWQDVQLPDPQRALLDELLSLMGYLGRAESWVEARRLDALPSFPEAQACRPGTEALDAETGEHKGEIVTLYAPLPPDEYQSLRQGFLADKQAAKKLAKTLPDNLLDALSVDTATLRKQGWNQPPAARKVSYLRPVEALRPRYAVPKAVASNATTASFILIGKPLPRVEDTLRIGELMRMAVMHHFGEGDIPPIFSGHNLPAGNRHRHAFYLPWDSNDDGQIDRLLLHAPDGMDTNQQRITEQVKKLWNRDGYEWRLVLENIGNTDMANKLTRQSTIWESVTPYLHPWHTKKHFNTEDQLRRECRERGLPEPTKLEQFDQVDVGKGRKRRPIHFQRFRNRRGLAQPDRLGSFWRLAFVEPISGPLALGFACHFGLGLFKPSVDS